MKAARFPTKCKISMELQYAVLLAQRSALQIASDPVFHMSVFF